MTELLTSMSLKMFPGSHDVREPRIISTSLLAWLGRCLWGEDGGVREKEG